MLTQRRLTLHFIFAVEVTLIGHQRHFCIDHHVLALRQAHDNVGLHPTLMVQPHVDLRFVFVPFPQARGFQHPT
ncbi:hypothetical protein D3C87_1928610 [compost metagenome]